MPTSFLPPATALLALLGALAVVLAVALGLLWGCGFLLVPALPRRARPLAVLVAPFLGFAAISGIAHYAGAAGLGLRSVSWVFVVLAAAGWIAAWRCGLLRAPRRVRAALACCGLGLLVALGPLFLLGRLTTVGTAIDGISYAVRSEYLQVAPPRLPASEPGKPYLGWVQAQIELGRVGDVYFVGLWGLLTGRRSYELLTVASALFFGLTAGAVYVLARSSLRLAHLAALLAAVLVAINNLLLWPVFDNFLSQSVGLALLPIVLWAGVEGQRRPTLRAAAVFGCLFSGLMSTYPAFAVQALFAVAAAWAVLAVARAPAARRPLSAAARWWAAAGGCALLSNAPAFAKGGVELAAVSGLFTSAGTSKVGIGNILVFPPPVEIFGLVAHAALALGTRWRQLPLALAWVVAGAATGLALYGWCRLPRRGRLVAACLLLTSIALLLHQRFLVNPPHGYPYGYFKTVTALTPLVLVLVAAGLVAAWRAHTGRWLAVATGLPLLAANLWATAWTGYYAARQCTVVTRDVIEAAAAASRLPPAEWLMVDAARGLHQHWLGYLLRDVKMRYRERLWAYHVDSPGAPNAFCSYALVERSVDRDRAELLNEPWYSPATYVSVWRNERFELRRRRDGRIGSLLFASPRWRRGQTLEVALPSGAPTITARLGEATATGGRGAGRPMTAQVQVFAPRGIEIATGGDAPPIALGAGAWTLDLHVGCFPASVIRLRSLAGDALLAGVRVLRQPTGRSGACVETVADQVGAAHVEQSVEGDVVRYRATLVPPRDAGPRTYRLGVHVGSQQGLYYGVWSLDFPPGQTPQTGELEIDLGDRRARGRIDGREAPVEVVRLDTAAGSFQADVVWWQLNPTAQLAVEAMLWFERDAAGGPPRVLRALPGGELRILYGS